VFLVVFVAVFWEASSWLILSFWHFFCNKHELHGRMKLASDFFRSWEAFWQSRGFQKGRLLVELCVVVFFPVSPTFYLN
jgi:hypothetical protein